MDPGFSKATSENLPAVNIIMFSQFLRRDDRFNIPEVKGSKASKATRESYGDTAVGYVQVKREGPLCYVKCKVCPEHKIKSKAYNVSLTVNETEEIIQDVSCGDCPAGDGGCKHGLALLGWVHRRTEDPTPTEVSCYWKKPLLSGVGTMKKFIEAKEFLPKNEINFKSSISNASIVESFINEAQKQDLLSHLTRYEYQASEDRFRRLSIHYLLLNFKQDGGNIAGDFISFCRGEVNKSLCAEAETATQNQSACPLWHELRYARITASKINEVAHCQTLNGTLVNQIIGSKKIIPTNAMKRGIKLESQVLKTIEQKLKIKIKKCGFLISCQFPLFGASPDGITSDYVVEIKCPVSEKTKQNYLKDGKIQIKYKAQVQLQMFVFGRSSCCFVVADPNFTENGEVTMIWEKLDKDFILNLISKAEKFWANAVFTKLFDVLQD